MVVGSPLDEICNWYRAQCDGDWEHCYGIVIESLDNPGWWVRIDLQETILQDVVFDRIQTGNNGDDSWIICEKKGTQFHGVGDPNRLHEILSIFLAWAKQQPNWLAPPDEARREAWQTRTNEELWDFLGESLGAESCRIDGCGRFRIRHSVYCRRHHWENVIKRPVPPGKTD
jgi:hypothetical protein